MKSRALHRGASLVEVTLVAALMLVLVMAFGVPGYRSYAASRASHDAATVLSSDLAFLVRAAQNASDGSGACLVIESAAPLSYRGYLGRPKKLDPNSHLGTVLFDRTFASVTLANSPIGTATALLFASNGSAQYESAGTIAPQHATIDFQLRGSVGKAADVRLDLFTGAVDTGG